MPRPTLRRSVASRPGQQRRAQQRLLVGQRVGQPQRAPARVVVAGQPERVEDRLATTNG